MMRRNHLVVHGAHPLCHVLLQWAMTGVLCLGLGAAFAAPKAVSAAAAERALQRAEARLRGLEQLQQQANQVRLQSEILDQAAKRMGRDLERALQDDSAARVAIQKVADCLPRLGTQIEASGPAIEALERSVVQSHRAVQAVARASADGLAQEARGADGAFELRAAAERQLIDAKRGLNAEKAACQQAVDAATSRMRSALTTTQNLGQQARAMPAHLQYLHDDLGAAVEASHAATDRQWLRYRAPRGAVLAGDRLAQLDQAAAGAPPPPRAAAIDAAPLRMLGDAGSDFERLAAALSRMEDAAAYLDLMDEEATRECGGDGCPSFAAERRDLAGRMQQARAELAAARRRIAQTPAALQGMLEPARATMLANTLWLQAIEPAVAPAIAQSALVATQAQAAAAELQRAVDPALAQARRDWEAAYALARGGPPPRPAPSAAYMSAPERAAVASMRPDLAGHAYEFFAAWNTEREGFGAYTYVLLRSAADLQRPDVQRRYAQLLTVVRREREASRVSAAEARNVNLFCIPGTASATGRVDALDSVYADDLGRQLLFRAQSGLLTRPEIKKLLVKSAGPFLVTLPGRIADARSSTPLLFADLGPYPDDAIADLVANYMGGLLTDFPRDQAVWLPPVPQRVALAMIRLASDTGGLVMSVIPTARATPGSR